MQDIERILQNEIYGLMYIYRDMGCRNSYAHMAKNLERTSADFLDSSLKMLYADARSLNFCDDLKTSHPDSAGTMRRSVQDSLDQMLDCISKEPSKKAQYSQFGLRPFDPEHTEYLRKFNDTLEEGTRNLDVKNAFRILDSYSKNIRSHYSKLFTEAMKNILGTNAKDSKSKIEELFSVDSTFLYEGKACSDLVYVLKKYKAKEFEIKEDRITFEGPVESFSYKPGDLVRMAVFAERKILLLSSVFCLIDIEKIRQSVKYYSKTQQ